MKIQIEGAGLAGCAIANELNWAGHEVALHDVNRQYAAYAICTGKVFPAKSDTPLAVRLNRGYDVYGRLYEAVSTVDVDDRIVPSRQLDLFEQCVKPLTEVIRYKNPEQKLKELQRTPIGLYVGFNGNDVKLAGYQLNASKYVSLTRSYYPEHIDNPDYTIVCTGAWDTRLEKPKVTPVRGITAEITIKNAPIDCAFHWPAKSLYYVPIPGQPNRYWYGTVLVPDTSFEGVRAKDNEKLLHSDDAYLMADWLVQTYGASVSMTGASGSISCGYRPWVVGRVPGYFKYFKEDRELHVNGLYQSGAQVMFYLADLVASAIEYECPESLEAENYSTKES